ncbi:hypothetical protein B484DRAFT_81175 [Ochromonadaceae sp. CCMP2298]|nr:hypothetical protein B484DRAFT_81175 [Ochromonadaceae sp. CCMP2298]
MDKWLDGLVVELLRELRYRLNEFDWIHRRTSAVGNSPASVGLAERGQQDGSLLGREVEQRRAALVLAHRVADIAQVEGIAGLFRAEHVGHVVIPHPGQRPVVCMGVARTDQSHHRVLRLAPVETLVINDKMSVQLFQPFPHVSCFPERSHSQQLFPCLISTAGSSALEHQFDRCWLSLPQEGIVLCTNELADSLQVLVSSIGTNGHAGKHHCIVIAQKGHGWVIHAIAHLLPARVKPRLQ